MGAFERFSSSRAARWENGYVESFNGKLRDELLNGESFYQIFVRFKWHDVESIRILALTVQT